MEQGLRSFLDYSLLGGTSQRPSFSFPRLPCLPSLRLYRENSPILRQGTRSKGIAKVTPNISNLKTRAGSGQLLPERQGKDPHGPGFMATGLACPGHIHSQSLFLHL